MSTLKRYSSMWNGEVSGSLVIAFMQLTLSPSDNVPHTRACTEVVKGFPVVPRVLPPTVRPLPLESLMGVIQWHPANIADTSPMKQSQQPVNCEGTAQGASQHFRGIGQPLKPPGPARVLLDSTNTLWVRPFRW
jgi:hypothetical protein